MPVVVTTTTVLPSTTTTSSPTTSTSIDPVSTSSSTAPPPTTATTVAAGSTPTIGEWFGDRLVTPEGLELGDLAPDSPLQTWDVQHWAGGICNEDVCRGWDL